MKKQITTNWKLSLLATMAILVLGGSATTIAQSIGAKYGSRDPRTCDDMRTPARGALSAAQATKYFICTIERQDGKDLFLVENVKVQVGGGIPYAAIIGHRSLPEIDVKHPVYPIRGSYSQYSCQVESDQWEPGKNCMRYDHQNAKGYCYKTTFGDWRCYQMELSVPSERIFERVPPPKGGKAPVANQPVEPKTVVPPVAPNNPNQPPKTTGGMDANGIAKPDFSELEKDFEIMKYEYDTSTRPPAIYITARVKRSNGGSSALSFEGRFYDSAGANIMIPAERVWVLSGDPAKVGDVVRLRAWTPSETNMRSKVKRIVVARIDQ